jgi:DHA1 family inner membrane transport protein
MQERYSTAIMSQVGLREDFVMTKENWSERGMLAILFIMQFCHIVDFVLMMPLGPQLMRAFNISTQQFGLLVSAYAVSAGIMGILAAFFTDHFDRKKTILFLYTGFAIGTLLCALAPNFHFLLIARIIAGAFGGIVGATALAIIGDVVPFERRGAAIGLVMSAFAVASVAGIPIGLKIAMMWGWHSPFMYLALISFLIAWIGYKILPSVRAHLDINVPRDSWKEFVAIIRNPIYQRAYCMTSSLSFSGFLVIPYISPYAVFNVQITESDLSWIYFFGGLFTFFSTNFVGKLTDRYGSFRIFGFLSLFSIVPTLLLTHASPMHLGIFLMITTVYMMSTSGRFTPAMNLMNSLVSQNQRGALMGISFSCQQLAAASAAYLAGMIIQKTEGQALMHYDWVGFISASVMLVSFGLAYSLRQYSKKK